VVVLGCQVLGCRILQPNTWPRWYLLRPRNSARVRIFFGIGERHVVFVGSIRKPNRRSAVMCKEVTNVNDVYTSRLTSCQI
jgi:hypothetical protein